MRIGLIAPPWIPVPPPAEGTEAVLDNRDRKTARQVDGVRRRVALQPVTVHTTLA